VNLKNKRHESYRRKKKKSAYLVLVTRMNQILSHQSSVINPGSREEFNLFFTNQNRRLRIRTFTTNLVLLRTQDREHQATKTLKEERLVENAAPQARTRRFPHFTIFGLY
jgi:hypothetical protein